MERRYKKPPLIEAVCEFRFSPDSPWDLTVPGLVYDKIRDTFPQKRPATTLELGFRVSEGQVEQKAQPTSRIQFVSDDEKVLVQVGSNLLAVNQLKPYPGWASFSPLIRKGYDAYVSVASPTGIARIGLRYINRIDLPGDKADLEDFFEFYPYLGPRLPKDYGDFLVRIETAVNECDGLRMHLGRAEPARSNAVALLLDIDYFSVNVESISVPDALRWVDHAHDEVGELFEGCITDRLRELFKTEGE